MKTNSEQIGDGLPLRELAIEGIMKERKEIAFASHCWVVNQVITDDKIQEYLEREKL